MGGALWPAASRPKPPVLVGCAPALGAIVAPARGAEAIARLALATPFGAEEKRWRLVKAGREEKWTVPTLPRLSRDSPGVGMGIGNGPAGLAQMREMRDERFGHPRLDLVACLPQSESTVHVRTVGAPGTVFGLFVYDEVVRQRKSRSPVVRRIAASVPRGTVSESLPATVTSRMPSALSHVSCEPVCRTLIQPSARNALRTSLNFFATARNYAANRTGGPPPRRPNGETQAAIPFDSLERSIATASPASKQ